MPNDRLRTIRNSNRTETFFLDKAYGFDLIINRTVHMYSAGFTVLIYSINLNKSF